MGNAREARQEWELIGPARRSHPDVLRASWFIYVALKQWEQGVAAAEALIRLFPADPEWYVNLANTIYWSGSPAAAREVAASALSRFPRNPPLHYNLACYESQLQQLATAEEWLKRAFELDARLRAIAPTDPDLQPLWQTISPSSLGGPIA